MRILFLGDVVGRPGRFIIKDLLTGLKDRENIDMVIANCENAASGSGLTPRIADDLLSYGIDIMTSGDHIFKKKDIYDYLKVSGRLVRPLNYPKGVIGRGSVLYKFDEDTNVAVISLLGRVFMDALDCPFVRVEEEIKALAGKAGIIIVDMHAEATSEKIAMGWFLDGKVSAVLGTHTHVQTADEKILPKGTAYITDCGMTGPFDSVIGREKQFIIDHFMTQMPFRFEMAENDVQMHGVILDIDSHTGKAVGIKRVQEKYGSK